MGERLPTVHTIFWWELQRKPKTVLDQKISPKNYRSGKCYTLWFDERKYHPYLIKNVKWFAAGGYCLIHQTSPYSEVGAADVPSQVDRYLASRSSPAETAASWRCDLLIKFLAPYYNSHFCVSFYFAIDHETLRRLNTPLNWVSK